METTVERGGNMHVCLHTQSGWEVKYTYGYNTHTQLEASPSPGQIQACATNYKLLGNGESDQQVHHQLCRDPYTDPHADAFYQS